MILLSKYRKYIVLFLLAFFISNRCYAIYMFNIPNKDMINCIATMFLDFLPSFGSNYLGFKFVLNPMALLVGIVTGILSVVFIIYKSLNKKNYLPGEEHGTARFGMEEEYKVLKDEDEFNNIPYSQHIGVSMDTIKTQLNNNTVTIGGSGSQKTRGHVKPSALQFNCNYILTDPKDRTIREIGKGFYENNYDIKYLNLVDMTRSMKYNPLKYIERPSDVLKFVNNFIDNTTKEATNQGGDDFFVKAEIAWMTFAIFFILASPDDSEKNLNTMMDLLDMSDASEEDENAKCEMDVIMEQLEESFNILLEYNLVDKNNYTYLAIRQYRLYKKAAGKTAKSILISLGVRLQVFNIPELKELISDDELDLETFGRPKKDKDGNYIKSVLFVSISDYDSTFSFMAAVIYQQLFEILYRIADSTKDGRLPIHTRFILDEFANTGKQQDFERKVATIRSREISVDIILQNLAQLKNLYKESWETIIGNCDVTLFLGGKEYSTLEQLSKWIGNTTIDYLNITENRGSNGGWSRSNQILQRPLLAPDEIGRLKRDECLIHIRGEHIFKDKKYNLMDHPNIELTTDYDEKNYFDPEIVVKEKRDKTAVLMIEEKKEEKRIEAFGNKEFLNSDNGVYVPGDDQPDGE